MGSHEHSTESQLFDHNHTAEMRRAIHPPPARAWVTATNSCQQEGGPQVEAKKKGPLFAEQTSLYVRVTDTTGGRLLHLCFS